MTALTTHLLRTGLAMLAVAAMLGAPAFAHAADAVADELKKFDGTWQLVSAVKDGKETPMDVVKKILVIIKDGKHTVRFGDEIIAKEIAVTIDPTKNPKTTVDILPDGKTIKGIYKLEGDMLTSCVAEIGKDHPTEFAAKPGTGHTLRVFQRVKM